MCKPRSTKENEPDIKSMINAFLSEDEDDYITPEWAEFEKTFAEKHSKSHSSMSMILIWRQYLKAKKFSESLSGLTNSVLRKLGIGSDRRKLIFESLNRPQKHAKAFLNDKSPEIQTLADDVSDSFLQAASITLSSLGKSVEPTMRKDWDVLDDVALNHVKSMADSVYAGTLYGTTDDVYYHNDDEAKQAGVDMSPKWYRQYYLLMSELDSPMEELIGARGDREELLQQGRESATKRGQRPLVGAHQLYNDNQQIADLQRRTQARHLQAIGGQFVSDANSPFLSRMWERTQVLVHGSSSFARQHAILTASVSMIIGLSCGLYISLQNPIGFKELYEYVGRDVLPNLMKLYEGQIDTANAFEHWKNITETTRQMIQNSAVLQEAQILRTAEADLPANITAWLPNLGYVRRNIGVFGARNIFELQDIFNDYGHVLSSVAQRLSGGGTKQNLLTIINAIRGYGGGMEYAAREIRNLSVQTILLNQASEKFLGLPNILSTVFTQLTLLYSSIEGAEANLVNQTSILRNVTQVLSDRAGLVLNVTGGAFEPPRLVAQISPAELLTSGSVFTGVMQNVVKYMLNGPGVTFIEYGHGLFQTSWMNALRKHCAETGLPAMVDKMEIDAIIFTIGWHLILSQTMGSFLFWMAEQFSNVGAWGMEEISFLTRRMVLKKLPPWFEKKDLDESVAAFPPHLLFKDLRRQGIPLTRLDEFWLATSSFATLSQQVLTGFGRAARFHFRTSGYIGVHMVLVGLFSLLIRIYAGTSQANSLALTTGSLIFYKRFGLPVTLNPQRMLSIVGNKITTTFNPTHWRTHFPDVAGIFRRYERNTRILRDPLFEDIDPGSDAPGWSMVDCLAFFTVLILGLQYYNLLGYVRDLLQWGGIANKIEYEPVD